MLLSKVKGYNLLEVMVTVAIVSIFASIALPSMFEMVKSNNIRQQSNAIHRALTIARSEAIKRGVSVTVCTINSSETDCSGKEGWENGWIIKEQISVADTDPIISIQSKLDAKYTIHGTTSSFVSTIIFTPAGTLSESGSLVVCHDDKVDAYSRTVTINRFGKVSVKGVDRITPTSCF